MFDSTHVNVGGYSSTTTTIATAQSAGLQTIAGNLTTIANGVSSSSHVFAGLDVRVNGNVISRTEHTLSGGSFHSLPFNTIANLNVGDVVSVQILPYGNNFQVSGGGGNYSHASLARPSPTTTGVKRLAAGQFYSGSTTTVNFDATQVNVGGYASSSGTIATAQAAGLQTIAGNLTAVTNSVSGPGRAVVDLNVLVNGNVVSRTEHTLSGGTFHTLPFNTLANLNPGDVVSLQINPFGNTIQVSGSNSGTFSHASLSRPSADTTGVQRGALAQTYGSVSTVLFDSTPVNVGGYATSAGTIATAQSTGLHTVAGNLTAIANGLSTETYVIVDLHVLVNGSVISRSEHTLGGSTFHALPFNTLANLNAGDVVSLQINPLFGSTIQVSGGSGNYSHASLSFTPVPEPVGILAACSLVCVGGGMYRRYVKRRAIA